LSSKIIGMPAGESSGSRVPEKEAFTPSPILLLPPSHPGSPLARFAVNRQSGSQGQWLAIAAGGFRSKFRTAYSDELASDSHGIPRYAMSRQAAHLGESSLRSDSPYPRTSGALPISKNRPSDGSRGKHSQSARDVQRELFYNGRLQTMETPES
jgi:hypothetical protein